MAATMQQTIKSGFRACEIFPLYPEVVLRKIPILSAEHDVAGEWSQTFVNLLKDKRFTEEPTRRRRKKIKVAPGKSVKCPKRKNSTSSSELDMSNDDEETENHFEKEYVDEDSLNVNNEIDQFVSQENAVITTDTFVIIKLTNKKITKNYVACVKEVIAPDTYMVHFLRKHESSKMGDYYSYPQIKDESAIEKHQIILFLRNVKDARRGKYQFNIPDNISTS